MTERIREDNSPKQTLEDRLLEKLKSIKTYEDLQRSVGEITPEEQAMLDRLNLDTEPTPEELEILGPDFTERLVKKAMAKIKEPKQDKQ